MTTQKQGFSSVTDNLRAKNRPITGALYRAKRSAHGEHAIKKDDLVMVVSENPKLLEKEVEQAIKGRKVRTTIREWADLVILYSERTATLTGCSEVTWYHWFERVDFSSR